MRVFFRPFAFRLNIVVQFIWEKILFFSILFIIPTEVKIHRYNKCTIWWWCVNRHFTRCITFCGLYISSTVHGIYTIVCFSNNSARSLISQLFVVHCGIYIYIYGHHIMCSRLCEICQSTAKNSYVSILPTAFWRCTTALTFCY